MVFISSHPFQFWGLFHNFAHKVIWSPPSFFLCSQSSLSSSSLPLSTTLTFCSRKRNGNISSCALFIILQPLTLSFYHKCGNASTYASDFSSPQAPFWLLIRKSVWNLCNSSHLEILQWLFFFFLRVWQWEMVAWCGCERGSQGRKLIQWGAFRLLGFLFPYICR